MNILKKSIIYLREKNLYHQAQKYDSNRFNNVLSFEKTKYGERIKKFRNIHYGKRCFILGNGPSLSEHDLDILNKNNEISFATNRIYNIFKKTNWRPTYYCCEDPLIIEEKQDEINDIKCDNKFIPINLKWYNGIKLKNCKFFFLNYDRDNEEEFSFSTDISKQINCRGTVTFTCIQIAAYMGFSEIYLLGVDHNYQKIIDENGNLIEDKTIDDYFCKDYDTDIKDKVVHDMGQNTRAYIDAKKYCDKIKKTTIYNATRGGKLEVFKRVNFDELF